MDHEEVALLYRLAVREEAALPRGGVMGWPLVLFGSFLPEQGLEQEEPLISEFFQAHIGN